MDAAQHAQAGAGARRAALHRRDDARRVPQARREGRGARAALPAGVRRRAVGRGHDRDPARPARSATRCTTACASRTRRSSRPRASRTATSPTASCPTRRSTSSTRRRAASAWRSTRCPSEIDEVERQITQLEIEREALKKEKDEASQARLAKLEQRAGRAATSRRNAARARSGSTRRRVITELRALQGADRAAARARSRRAEREGDLNRRPRSATAGIPSLERELEAARGAARRELQRDGAAHGGGRPREEIAEVVARWTGIPVSQHARGRDARSCSRWRRRLAQRVVGQDEAVAAVSERGAARARRPAGPEPARSARSSSSGPTGVGKTETAKALAEFLFDDEQAMVRIDMSEYMEKHAVARLIGAPPGLRRLRGGRAAHRGGAAPALRGDALRRDREGAPRRVQRPAADPRRRPAHRRPGPDGGLHEHRHHHDARTSAAQSALEGADRRTDELREPAAGGDGRAARPLPARVPEPDRRDRRLPAAQPRAIGRIVELQLARLRKLLAERGIALELSEAAREALADDGYDPVYGARPLKRALQRSSRTRSR